MLISVTPAALWAVLVRPLPAEIALNLQQVILLGVAVALVAAGGNVVNDIADRTIDRLNDRPNVLLDQLSVRTAWITYVVLNLVAAVLTWQLAAETQQLRYVLLLPLAVGLLFAYAFALKCMPWAGNLVVAAFCAGVPALLLLAEPAILSESGSTLSQSLLAYIVFAFFGTWARELVKDLEDREGDAAAGCRPLAVRWPAQKVHVLIACCMFVVLATVAYVAALWAMEAVWVSAISWAALWLLLAAIVTQLSPKLVRSDYKQLSRNLKIAIAFGLLLLLLAGSGTQL